jgi:hypothetical protein
MMKSWKRKSKSRQCYNKEKTPMGWYLKNSSYGVLLYDERLPQI